MSSKSKKNSSVVSSSVVSSSVVSSFNRNSSIFTEYPTYDFASIGYDVAKNEKTIDNLRKTIDQLIKENIQLTTAKNIASREIDQKNLETEINKKAIALVEFNKTIGIDLDMDKATQQIKSSMNIPTVNNTGKRISMNNGRSNGRSNSTNYDLVYNALIEFKGISANDLPLIITESWHKGEFDSYNKLKPFYHTIHNNTGSGIFAQMINHYKDNLTIDHLNELKTGININGVTLRTDSSSILYMKKALVNLK